VKDVNSAEHPCFSVAAARKFTRLHLPVAPACNIKCSYCNRKFDCVNESRPGVTSSVLTPAQGRERFVEIKRRFPNLRIVGVAGPGDAFANPDETFETFRLIREVDANVDFCLSTNGVALVQHLDRIRDLKVRYITVTINSRRLEVARELYVWAKDGGVYFKGDDAARLVLERQAEALAALRGLDVHLKINTIFIPGVNDGEIEGLTRWVAERGADIVNVMPFIPTPGTDFERFAMVSREALARVQNEMSRIVPMMRHCRQCRADAVGNVLDERPVFVENHAVRELPACSRKSEGRPEVGPSVRFAVTSKTGFVVDQHFGHAGDLLVYDATETSITFVGRRPMAKYCAGPDTCDEPEDRMERALASLADCQALLTLRIGDSPRRRLEAQGLLVAMTCNRVEDAIRESYGHVAERVLRPIATGA
jgi:MoaA/NifB/PqqE/SkfB family radical SAM enzyme